jgi:hypothetical protein
MRFCYGCERNDTPECEHCHMLGYGVNGDLEYLVFKPKGVLNASVQRMGQKVFCGVNVKKVYRIRGGNSPMLFR